MPKHIVILSSLDTKGEEASYLKDLIESQGFKTILMDTSIGGEPALQPDISSGKSLVWEAGTSGT